MRRSKISCVLAAALVAGVAGAASGQVRIAEWNITNYSSTSGRDAAFRTALYGISDAVGAGNGLQFAPDIIVVQEIIESISGQTQQQAGNASVAAFLGVLNTAVGSPADWLAAPYNVDNGDTGNAMFYRGSKFSLMGNTSLTTNTGTGPNQAPRDTGRWLVRLSGYTGVPAQLYLYGGHFKAGSSAADQLRRNPEGERIRLDANALADNANFAVCADFNVQNDSQVFYQYMVGNSGSPAFTSDASGRFFDPIIRPAVWENSNTYRFIHTQDQALAMDSRHDQILIAGNLRNGQGMDYLPFSTSGNIAAAWNLSTWNDINHSYRCWGNDGSSFNAVLNTSSNAMVGNTIATALVNSAAGGGHLPVYLDLQVPAKIVAPASIAFGSVPVNSSAQVNIQVSNGANLALWSKDGTGRGIDVLNYSMAASSGFTAPGGSFADTVGGGVNSHFISMNTSSPGPKAGTLTITSDDADTPVLVINITGTVTSQPDYDVNNDGSVDIEDLYAWVAGNTDVDGSGTVTAADGVALRGELRSGETPDITIGR